MSPLALNGPALDIGLSGVRGLSIDHGPLSDFDPSTYA